MNKSIYPVTIAETENDHAMDVVSRLAHRFYQLNGVMPKVLTADDFADVPHKISSYMKAWLWDLVPEDVEYIFYYDWDVVPARALEDREFGKFAAVCGTGFKKMVDRFPLFKKTGKFFNAGLFVAHRSTRPIFEQLKAFCANDLGYDGQLDQLPFNLLVQSSVEVTWLPETWNYMLMMAENYVRAAKMLHFTGCMPAKWKILDGMLDVLELAEK